MKEIVIWDSKPPGTKATVREIPHFIPRGMPRVYGRGDHYGPNHSFRMDIWLDRKGPLLMRCWSRCSDIDGRSFEITSARWGAIPVRKAEEAFTDFWIPKAVRKAYEAWIIEEF
jgi:hypothetical protein